MKAFISHSSNDKVNYIEKVISKFSPDEIFYDSISFQEGQLNRDEMLRGIDECALFVIFISESSLNSSNVQYELKEAIDKLGKSLRKIYPIIIDEKISYNDSRIPEELLECNIQLIKKPTVAARRIRQRLRELTWEKMPVLSETQNLFVGRNSLVNDLEIRLHDYSQKRPNILITSGIESIGRKSFVEFVLKKNNIVLKSSTFPTIEISSHESIEDFILKIDDLGLTSFEFDKNMMNKSVLEKVQIVKNILLEIENEREIIMIIDNGGIVKADRSIAEWFARIIEDLSNLNRVFMLLISNYEPSVDYIYSNENIYSMKVPELSMMDRSNLFSSLCRSYDLDIKPEETEIFLDVFHGFPAQIQYAIYMIRKKSVSEAMRLINDIHNFKIDSVQKLIKEYQDLEIENGDIKLKIIRVLTEFDFIDYSFFYKIFGETDEIFNSLEELLSRGVCETIGKNSDYFKLNTTVREMIRRQPIPMDEEYERRIKVNLKESIKKLNEEEDLSLSEYFESVKSFLKTEEVNNLDPKYLIPSHYLKTMKELYDIHRKWDNVRILAEKVLENRRYMDEGIIREIEYYYCISLARLKDRKFESEIQKSTIKSAEKFFLKAIYNRQIGNLKFALENIKNAIDLRPEFNRAKREMVTIYLSLEDFSSALSYAKENYEKDMNNNPYHIHAYFTCLINSANYSKEELLKLIGELERNQSLKGRELYYRSRAQYISEVENHKCNALVFINDALKEFKDGNDIYLLMDKFYISLKQGNLEGMRESNEAINSKKFNKKTQFYHNSMKINAIFYAYQKDERCWEYYHKLENYPNHKLMEFKAKIENMMS